MFGDFLTNFRENPIFVGEVTIFRHRRENTCKTNHHRGKIQKYTKRTVIPTQPLLQLLLHATQFLLVTP